MTGIAVSFAGPGPGAAGANLVLFDVTVRALAAGSATVLLAPFALQDSSLQSIAVDSIEGSVVVTTPIPEPAVWPVLAGAIAVVVRRGKD